MRNAMAGDQERDGGADQGGVETPSVTDAAATVVMSACAASPAVCAATRAVKTGGTNAGATAAVHANSVAPLRREERAGSHAQADVAWRRQIPRDVRDDFVDAIARQLKRVTGESDPRYLRKCATRYEIHVFERSSSEMSYLQAIERRMASLRQQASRSMEVDTSMSAGSSTPAPGMTVPPSTAEIAASLRTPVASMSRSGSRRSRRSSRHASSAALSPEALAARDLAYFARLRRMRTAYRDEVAIVFRELCRVETVIQSSSSLRRHGSNNLGEFLKNLKKVIHLLEQQPDEMHGIIPARKRTLEYLDVVEAHIQRKVLPVLYRLRHTYSTLLRPIVLNYLKNNARTTWRL